jgi:Flp pilus assembly protein TadD
MKKYIIVYLLALCQLNAFSQVADKFLIKAAMLSDSKMYEDAATAIAQSTSGNTKIYNKVLGDINLGLKNYDTAIDNYVKAGEVSNETYNLDLAKAYAMSGNKPKALEYLTQYLKQKNKLPLSKINNDEAFIKYRSDPDWQKTLQNADYSDLEIAVNRINSLAEAGYNEYFNTAINEALSKYPSNSELLYQQSRYFEENKLYSAALKSITQALSQKPQNDLFLNQKAMMLWKNNETYKALTAINEAINLNPFNLKYYITRIDLNKAQGNTDKVNEDAGFIEFCVPENAEVQLVKIQAEIEKQNYFTALTLVNTLLEKDKNNAKYYIVRGNIYLKALKYQNADNDFGMSLDLNPSDPEANLGKGIAKIKLNDITSGCFYLQKASNEGNREAIEYVSQYCNKN